MNNNNQNWLAAYLYYGEPWEDFLLNLVAPFVEMVFNKNFAEQYFFIRYWERGPHIRLRFKGNRKCTDKDLKPKIEKFFTEYFREKPSGRKEPQFDQPEGKQWFPNNSVQFIEYEPETERYGGPVGTDISEELFQASSNAVLKIFKENPEWNYENSLAAGIQMHLGFSHSFGLSRYETIEFFSKICSSWDMALINISNREDKQEIIKKRENLRKSFEENFQSQKPMLSNFTQLLQEVLNSNTIFENEWLNNWLSDLNLVSLRLTKAIEKKQIIFPSWFRYDDKLKAPESKQALWSILYSYIHMTNNRLGILNQDEAYLAYLIKRSVESI